VKVCPVCATQYGDEVKFCPNDGQTLRSSAPASNLVGQVVADRYHIIKKLGEGGMGQVYLGEHVKMGRRSAIKVMNPSMVHDPDAVARFNREAANASRITHPNVCAIYDFGETPEGLIYLAMEYIEGEPLTDLLQREGPLPTARAVHIFTQTGDALQAAHDLGIVHRDLKPDNIMVSRGRDGGDVVKVVDFGIAKAVGGDEAGQKVTKTGLVVGTPEFMSPEQLAGDKVDGRSDLYALALVFFQTLTGRLPFEAETVQETMIKRLTDEPMKLAAARPDLSFPAGLQPVLDSALARSPGDRYQTVVKFADDVKSVTGTAGTRHAPVPATREFADGATQLLDTTATKQVAAKRGAAAGRTTPQPAARKRSLVPVAIGAVVLLGAGGAGVALLGGNKPTGVPSGAESTATVRPADTMHNGGSQRPAPGGGRAPADTPVAVDTAAINRELGDMIEPLADPAQRPRVRNRAQEIYDDVNVPVRFRAEAAFTVANAYLQDQRPNDSCRWSGFALQLQPNNAVYRRYRAEGGCS
jgi:serine/threonine-protein kinase